MSIPICFFPTTILFIDDNKELVESISEVYKDNKEFLLKGITDCNIARQLLRSTPTLNDFLPLNSLDSNKFRHSYIEVDLNNINNLITDTSKQNMISIIIIDYKMPQINGLDFLREINNPNLVKIMLTGEADEKIAIEAFNKNLINYFISKGDNNIFEKLKDYIIKAQTDYFIKSCKLINDSIIFNSNSITALNEDKFHAVFFKLVKQFDIKEYYLIEEIGSFILKDNNKKEYVLFISNKEYSNTLYDLIDDDNFFKEAAIKEIKEGKKILCYYNKDHIEIPSAKSWPKYLKDAKNINGKNGKYFYYFGLKNF